jgi:hypothetical protein
LPTLPPGGPSAGAAPSSFPPPTQIATPTGSKAAAAPVAPRPTAVPQQRPMAVPVPARAAVSGLDKVLAVIALLAVIAAAVSTGWCMNLLMHDGVLGS